MHAVDPSPRCWRSCARAWEHGISNIDFTRALAASATAIRGDVALMAHVGYDIEDFGAFLDAAEAAVAGRCVAVMRAVSSTTPTESLWQEVHGEPRVRLPMLVRVVGAAGGSWRRRPEVRLCERETWGYESLEALSESARQMLWLRPGSAKDERLRALDAAARHRTRRRLGAGLGARARRHRHLDHHAAKRWPAIRSGPVVSRL